MAKYHETPDNNGPNLVVAVWSKMLKSVFKNKRTRSLLHLQKLILVPQRHTKGNIQLTLYVNIRNESQGREKNIYM